MITNRFIDEMALLRAFIDHQTLSYTDVQEKGIVPELNKQDRRAAFKSSIDKFRQWGLIESVPGSDPRAWTVIPDAAVKEYEKLVRDIGHRQLVEKYSFAHLQDEVREHGSKLRWNRVYRWLTVTGLIVALFHFITGLTLMQALKAVGHIFRSVTGYFHL